MPNNIKARKLNSALKALIFALFAFIAIAVPQKCFAAAEWDYHFNMRNQSYFEIEDNGVTYRFSAYIIDEKDTKLVNANHLNPDVAHILSEYGKLKVTYIDATGTKYLSGSDMWLNREPGLSTPTYEFQRGDFYQAVNYRADGGGTVEEKLDSLSPNTDIDPQTIFKISISELSIEVVTPGADPSIALAMLQKYFGAVDTKAVSGRTVYTVKNYEFIPSFNYCTSGMSDSKYFDVDAEHPYQYQHFNEQRYIGFDFNLEVAPTLRLDKIVELPKEYADTLIKEKFYFKITGETTEYLATNLVRISNKAQEDQTGIAVFRVSLDMENMEKVTLRYGTKYTVKEINSQFPEQIGKYIWYETEATTVDPTKLGVTQKYHDLSDSKFAETQLEYGPLDTTQAGTVHKLATAVVSFVNRYKAEDEPPKLASLKVAKLVKDKDGNLVDLSDTASKLKSFYAMLVEVDAATGNEINPKYIELNASNSFKDQFTSLDPQKKYRLYEVTENHLKVLLGAELEAGWKPPVYEGSIEPNTNNVILSGETQSATIINAYEPIDIPTSLKVTKVIAGENAPEAKFYATLFYIDSAGNKEKVITQEIKENTPVTFAGLDPAKEYYIYETDISGNIISGEEQQGKGHWLAPKYSGLDNESGKVSPGADVTIINTYVEQPDENKGSLTIIKHANKYYGKDNSSTKFSFTVIFTDSNGDRTETFTLKDGESKEFTGLEDKTSYLITENAPNYSIEYISSNSGIIDGDSAISVAAINTAKGAKGKLVITKRVSKYYGTDNIITEFNFTIRFKDEDGERSESFSLKAGESKTFDNLSEGTQYEITENAPNYKVEYAPSKSGTIKTNPVTNVIVTNYAKTSKGKLVITKKIKQFYGTDNSSTDFSFDVIFDKGLPSQRTESFKLKAGKSVEFTDLPAGMTYEITETAPNYSITYDESNTGAIKANSTVNVTVTNKPKSNKGGLTVKKVVPKFYNRDNKSTLFKIAVVFNNGLTSQRTEIFNLKAGESIEFKDLEAGTTFEILETAQNYKIEYVPKTGVIKADTTITAKVINTGKHCPNRHDPIDPPSPVTGDKSSLGVLMVALASALAIFVLAKKRIAAN